MVSALTMQPPFFSFLLTAVHVSVLVDCRLGLEDPEQRPQHLQSCLYTGAYADTSNVEADTSNSVSVLDVRRKQLLCMGLKGELDNSKQRDKEGFLLWHILNSTNGGQAAHQELPEPSSPLLKTILGALVRRQRRSEEVNPSDPLRSQSHPSFSVRDHKNTSHSQLEHDQAGAVSKETITSCDDPLKVLQPNGPGSPLKINVAEQD
uniref:uncharacterized protein LOC109961802 n=1 Tax=Monopterus albus TaxID=43700 RepID=UPI0009B44674|nr:uncharacterized protein LOC109961802 [Monopterus albus]